MWRLLSMMRGNNNNNNNNNDDDDDDDYYRNFYGWVIPFYVEEISIDTKGDMIIAPQIIKFPRNFVTPNVIPNITPISNPWGEILLDKEEFNRLMENYP